MYCFNIRRVSLAAVFSVAVLTTTFVVPATADDLYLPSGVYTANDATYKNATINVGEDDHGKISDPGGNPYIATLNVVDGGDVLFVNSYNPSTVNVSGGKAGQVLGFLGTTINISGGTVTANAAANQNSRVNVTGGSVNSVLCSDIGTFHITNGTIDSAFAYNATTADITGGTVGIARATTNSTLNITGGTLTFAQNSESGTVNISGGAITQAASNSTGTINISNGNITNAYARDNATVNVSGGTLHGAYGYLNGIVNISGGFVTEAIAYDNSALHITGGTVSNHTIYQYSDTASVYFTGLAIAYSGAVAGTSNGFNGVYYDVAWTRSDDVLINTRYFDVNGDVNNATPQGVTFTMAVVVPEAGTLALFGAGGLALSIFVRRRKK